MGDSCKMKLMQKQESKGMRRLTQRQETFCLKYFELGNASEAARIALYSPKTAAVIGAENLLKPKIIERIKQLRQKVEGDSIASVTERKQILTEITRGNLLDYQEVGADGAWLNIGKESPNTRAISEITSRTDEKDSVITKVKLHSPTQAIDLLNKMDKVYSDNPAGFQDNRQYNLIIQGEEAKKKLGLLLSGTRPKGIDGDSD